jgi:hypothetical protein
MPKAPKKPPGCFYSGLTGAQLAECLRAVNAPVSAANKGELVARLRAHPLSAPYAVEGRAPTLSRATVEFVGGRDGLQLADIKERCKEAGVKTSGNKFDLVLRLLQLAGGVVAPPAATAPRAPSTKPVDAAKLEARVLAKCEAGGDRDGWSNQRHKEHAGDAFRAAWKWLHAETHEKGLLAARSASVVDAAAAVLRALHAGWHALPRPSYDFGSNLREVGDLVREVGAAMAGSMTAARRAEMRALCDALARQAKSHSMDFLDDLAASFAEPA